MAAGLEIAEPFVAENFRRTQEPSLPKGEHENRTCLIDKSIDTFLPSFRNSVKIIWRPTKQVMEMHVFNFFVSKEGDHESEPGPYC